MALKVVQNSLIRSGKKVGIGVNDQALQRRIVDWIAESAAYRGSINDVSAVLFNAHSDTLARHLLARQVKKITMIEGCPTNSQLQRNAIESFKNILVPGQECHALHANVESVLIPSKVHPVKNSFWEGLHDIGGVVAAAYENKKFGAYRTLPQLHSTVLVAVLPFPAQQRALLQALLNQLIIYYMIKPTYRRRRSKKGETSSSYFEFGHFSLITFLHRSEFARLISATPPDGKLLTTDFLGGIDFFVAPHFHFSHLFQTLFDVKLPAGVEPFPLTAFKPLIPSTPVTAYASKLDAIGLDPESVYAVQFEPKLNVTLPGNILIPFSPSFPVDKDEQRHRDFISLFAGWMTSSAKLGATQPVLTTLKNLLGESIPTTCKLETTIQKNDRVRNVTAAQFSQLFDCLLSSMSNNSLSQDLAQQLDAFKNGLHRTSDEKFVD